MINGWSSSFFSIVLHVVRSSEWAYLHVLSWLLTPPPQDLEQSDHGLHVDQKARFSEWLFFGAFVAVGGWGVVVVVVVDVLLSVTRVNGRRLRSFQRLDGVFLDLFVGTVGVVCVVLSVSTANVVLHSSVSLEVVVGGRSVVDDWLASGSNVVLASVVTWFSSNCPSPPERKELRLICLVTIVGVAFGVVMMRTDPLLSCSSEEVIRSYL